jgi:hypothetical protein
MHCNTDYSVHYNYIRKRIYEGKRLTQIRKQCDFKICAIFSPVHFPLCLPSHGLQVYCQIL